MSSVGFIRRLYTRGIVASTDQWKENSWRKGIRRISVHVYSIHARGQLFLFRSDFTERPSPPLPSPFPGLTCTRIPKKLLEIRFYSGIGLENARGKQFPVKR